jgi:large subunit ribosomal protein L7/L12
LREDLKVADNNKLAEVKELLNSLTVLEAAQLAKDLQDEWGVSAAAPAMAAMPGMMAPAAEAEAEEEEKTEFDIYITDVGPQKIQVIKAVRELTSLGLREAKEAVEAGAEAPVRQGISKDDAEQTKERLEEAGATVDIR